MAHAKPASAEEEHESHAERHFSISRALAFFDFRERTIVNLWKVPKLIIGIPTREWTIRLPEIPKTEQRYFTPKEMQDIHSLLADLLLERAAS